MPQHTTLPANQAGHPSPFAPDEDPPAASPGGPSRRSWLVLAGSGLFAAAGAGYAAQSRGGSADSSPTAGTTGGAAAAVSTQAAGATGFFSADRLHDVVLDIGDADFASAVAAYEEDGSKEWIEIGVSLDGTDYDRAGARLKGHSTLDRTPAGSAKHEYPWLIRLDKFVDGQSHQGATEFVVRLNNSTSALNEPVALDLLAAAGLTSQGHAFARVSAVGSDPVLRVIVENPGEAWVERAFPDDGILYKAESSGDYSYRGADMASYEEVFTQENGEDDLSPLIAFLDFVNNADDADFASTLSDHLEVEKFATYLAFEDLVDNYDAIDGPGNNSYLWWAQDSDRMTVVGWDHNLTFGVSNRPGAQGRNLPAGGMPGRGGSRKSNPFVQRFEAVPEYAALVAAASQRLRAALFTSGVAGASLEKWSGLLGDQASDLVPAQTLAADKAQIAAYLT